ncbi:phage tail protein [Cupriavidus sp. 2SB]|uniref:phage tail protein n=1 Tax=Cupriavidus sp. 2SB TaxID=2502199 RepID=UPI0010F6989D|nr:phage tail protein [Cupriavidus sp. 2SB]
MPAAAAAAVGAWILGAGSSVLVANLIGAAVYAVTAIGISFAIGSLMGAIFKPRTNNGFASEAQGRTQIVRSNVQPRNMIYGRAMTSGPLVFAGSTDGEKKNQFMHLVVVLADHECDAIEEVYLGEDAVGPLDANGNATSGRYSKSWSDTRRFSSAVAPGQTTFALDPGVPITRIISLIATSGGGLVENPYPTYTFTPGASLVTITNMDPNTTWLDLEFEAKVGRSLVRIKKHLGGENQSADSDMVAELAGAGWTWDHRLRGVCYIYVRLEYDADLYPNGLPNIKALVRGKPVYDPRHGITAWSANWAICTYDYLRDTRGFGCDDSDIDIPSVINAANICSEYIEVAPGQFDQRYLCNGIVMLDKSPRDNLAELITAGGGTVTITGGVFRLFAGAYDIPTVTLTESDLRGPVKVQARTSRKDLFNRVKGTYVSPANSWQPSDFPAVGNSLYSGQDGEVIDRDIELPFTTDAVQAQRLAKIILERSRQGIVVDVPAKMTAFQLTAYSTVYLTLAKFGWTNKVFRVMSWKMSEDGGVDLVLNEEAAAVYDWNYGNATTLDPAPDTNLPSPYVVPELGAIALDSGEQHLILNGNGQIVTRVLATWPAVTDAAISVTGKIELQYKRADAVDWQSLAPVQGDTTSFYLSPVEDGMPYVVRGRLVSALGVRSRAWSYSPVHVVVGKLAPPANMTGLSMTVLNGFANMTWDAATDLDVRNGGQARIRHTTDLVQPSWGSAIDIGGLISGAANSAQLPLLAGVYLGKWIDSTGHESAAAAMVITTAPSLETLNVVATITEQPAFSGAKSNVVFDPALNGIKLIGAGLIDDQGLIDASGLWDAQGAIDSLGPIDAVVGAGGWGLIDSLGGIVGSGTYTFAGALDLGTVEKSRLTATIDALSFDTGDMIDYRYDLIDGWESIDGDRISDTAVSLYVRATNDNPAGAPVWSDWQRFAMGDYEARAFQWKVVLESGSATHNLVVTGLSVGVDMPDRRESGRDVISGAGAKSITFNKPFRVVPVMGITAQNMAQGDYFVLTPKTESGFTVTFYNAASTPVSRRFDWDAVAY